MSNRGWAVLIVLIGLVFVMALVIAGWKSDNDNIIPPLDEWPTTSVPGEGVNPYAPSK